MVRFIGPLTLLLLLTACSEPASKTARTKDNQKSGVLVMNQFQGFSTLHPPASYENSSSQLGSHLFETLTCYDPETLELAPLLAEEWEVNDENTEFIFKIRKDVYFHDDPCFKDGIGRKMTPEDILYCLKVLCEKNSLNENGWLLIDLVEGAKEFNSNKGSALTDEISGLEIIEDDKIRIRLTRPEVEFLHILTHYGTSIYPREAWQNYGRQIGNHPVGTGPFRMKTLRLDEICILERNERYWGVDEFGKSLPYLNGIKVGFVKNGQELAKSMNMGLLHLVLDPSIVEGSDKVKEVLDKMPDRYQETFATDLETVYLAFLNDTGIFSDSRIRKAFDLALDKRMIIDEALQGNGEPGQFGFVPLGFKNYPYQDLTAHSYDVEAARAYLAEAGFPDGQGFPVVTLQIQNRYKDVTVAQEIQKQILATLGISLSITAIPRQQHFERTESGKAVLWLDNWIADYRTPENFLNIMLSSNIPEAGDSYLNTYRYRSSKFDTLMEESMNVKDQIKRYKKYAQADYQFIIEDAGVVPIYYERSKIIKHRSVKGLSAPMFGRFNMRKVYIEQL